MGARWHLLIKEYKWYWMQKREIIIYEEILIPDLRLLVLSKEGKYLGMILDLML